jgi:hypothetical protein
MKNGQRSLLVASSPNFGNQIHPIWSPDGQWIAMTVWEATDGSQPGLALLQPDTCRFIRLDDLLAGWLSSWVP